MKVFNHSTNRKKPDRLRHIFIAGVMLLSTAAACWMPGTAPAGEPTLAPNALATLIAGTAEAAVRLTETAAAALRTPTPTETPTPTLTVTALPRFSTEGTALIGNPDGSTTFVDQAGGYELKLPAGWMLVRVNQQELLDAWSLPEAANPNVRHFLDQVQKSDPGLFRLFGADTLPEHLQTGFVTNLGVLWDRANTDSIEQNLATIKNDMLRSILNTTIWFDGTGLTSSAIPIGIIESTSTLSLTTGGIVDLYQKQVILRLREGALSLTLSTPSELKGVFVPGFDALADGIVLSGP